MPEDDFFASSGASQPWSEPTAPSKGPPRVTTTRTRATSTSFGLVGRTLITVIVLLVPGTAIALAISVGGGLLAADPFQVASLLVTLGFAGWIIRETWKPAKRVRR